MSKTLNDLLLLGDPRLYQKCDPVLKEENHLIAGWVADLHSVMEEVRRIHGFGRGIAAPQLGIMKRLFYLNVEEPKVLINPILSDFSTEQFELWDDCMSFPNLLVRVKRFKKLKISYFNERWEQKEWWVKDDLAELVQHEFDHLNGVLCTMRAIDNQSFKWRE